MLWWVVVSLGHTDADICVSNFATHQQWRQYFAWTSSDSWIAVWSRLMRFSVTASSVYVTNWPITAKRKFICMSKFNMLCVVRWANFANICEYARICVSVADPLQGILVWFFCSIILLMLWNVKFYSKYGFKEERLFFHSDIVITHKLLRLRLHISQGHNRFSCINKSTAIFSDRYQS